jgi:hypothetical protein
MTTDSTVSRLLALIDHEIEIIVSVLSAASHTGGGSSPFTLMRKRDTAVDPNDDLLASYFRAVVAEYLDALADGDCDSFVRLALGRLRADPAAARRDMYRATFAIVIVAGYPGKGLGQPSMSQPWIAAPASPDLRERLRARRPSSASAAAPD